MRVGFSLFIFLVTFVFDCSAAEASNELSTDVAIYGGTPAGIAAALAARQHGHQVLILEPTSRIGGMVTNGLTHPDFRTFEGLTGTYLKFTQRVLDYYRIQYGPDSPQVRDCLKGTHAEPEVNYRVFRDMIDEAGVEVHTGTRLASAFRSGDRLERIELSHGEEQMTVAATVFIDASYEGDLMAGAEVPFRVGREGKDEYGESLAPEKADDQLQGYNFRLTMTRDPENRVAIAKPAGYRREEFAGLLPLLEDGTIKRVFCYPSGGIYKAQIPVLPNGKHDINDVSRAPVRLSLPGVNRGWPTGDAATRNRIFNEHLRHNVGMLYFLQNDEAVPEKFRREAREWGLCKDEFTHNNHLPEQLYVREARRMVGRHVFTERDTDPAPGDARSVFHPDAIAMGDYGPNCHGTAHEGPRLGGKHTGEFYKRVAPYQIPYGTITPKKVANLLVPVACSASHVGFCALRLEPIWTSLGQAAGHAAHLAIKNEEAVQEVSPATIRELLHAEGGATIYVSDVPPSSPDFAAVQWWGAQGGWHGVESARDEPGKRGEHLVGQYYRAFPGHAAKLDAALAPELRKRWNELAADLGTGAEGLERSRTRGEFVRAAYARRPGQ